MKVNSEREMSLIGHLTELRSRLIISIAALVVCMFTAFFVSDPILRFLTKPIEGLAREPDRDQELALTIGVDGIVRVDPESLPDPEKTSTRRLIIVHKVESTTGTTEMRYIIGEKPSQQFYYLSPLDPIMMKLKVAFIMGILVALPIIIRQIWMFITPGLTDKERRVVKPILWGAIVLFPIGAMFAFYMVKVLLIVMQAYVVEGIDPLLDIFKYLSLLTTLMLIFGVIFELPLVIAIAARIGLVSPETLRYYRRHSYVGLAVVSMFLTPADPFTMLMAFVPLVGLYELSLALAKPMAYFHQRDQQE